MFLNLKHVYINLLKCLSSLDMTKRAVWVGFGSGQMGRGLSRVASQVELIRIFQKIFFFFLSRCNLSIVYEFFNYN